MLNNFTLKIALLLSSWFSPKVLVITIRPYIIVLSEEMNDSKLQCYELFSSLQAMANYSV